MAGTIDIRYDFKTRLWTAKPRAAYDKESFLNGVPSASASNRFVALEKLCQLLPPDIANKIRLNTPKRIYRSPEYEWMDDRCIDMDGHWPSPEEWRERRIKYLEKKRIDEIIQSALSKQNK